MSLEAAAPVILRHGRWERCGHCGADVAEGYMPEHVRERCIVLHPDPSAPVKGWSP